MRSGELLLIPEQSPTRTISFGRAVEVLWSKRVHSSHKLHWAILLGADPFEGVRCLEFCRQAIRMALEVVITITVVCGGSFWALSNTAPDLLPPGFGRTLSFLLFVFAVIVFPAVFGRLYFLNKKYKSAITNFGWRVSWAASILGISEHQFIQLDVDFLRRLVAGLLSDLKASEMQALNRAHESCFEGFVRCGLAKDQAGNMSGLPINESAKPSAQLSTSVRAIRFLQGSKSIPPSSSLASGKLPPKQT